jgi:hypothetical protein
MFRLALICILISAIIFLPTAILLVFGMMPTIAAYTIDKSVGKSKTLCVGFMNFAGCFPFLLEFWTEFADQSIQNAFILIADVQNMIVMYLIAGGGYAIDLAVTGIMANFIIQNAQKRLKKIKKKQNDLSDYWGEKVTGKYELDPYGFPVDTHNTNTK